MYSMITPPKQAIVEQWLDCNEVVSTILNTKPPTYDSGLYVLHFIFLLSFWEIQFTKNILLSHVLKLYYIQE